VAAAGVGTRGVGAHDRVDLSNLQRQVIHGTSDIGRSKVESARRALAEINPEVRVEVHEERLEADNAERLVSGYDLVADGSDNFATRFLLNDVCHRLRKTLVAAAILRFDGQVSTYKAWAGGDHPCLRCVFPVAPSEDAVPSCAQAGVLGSLAGTLGALQATEVVKEILGVGRSLSGRLVMYDALAGTWDEMAIAKRPGCPTCGAA
jgi:adenylyltransferase/sulfurtransferase